MLDKHPEMDKNKMPRGKVSAQERDWFEPRISADLMNQYPDLYWVIVFSFFEAHLSYFRVWQHGLTTVAAFLDCHGFVPAQYHHKESTEVFHYYRTQERPRLEQLWRQFVASVNYPSEPAHEVFVPTDPHPIEMPRRLYDVWTDQGVAMFHESPTSRANIVMEYDTLFDLLVDGITEFEQGYLKCRAEGRVAIRPARRTRAEKSAAKAAGHQEFHQEGGKHKYVFMPLLTVQTRHAYYLTLYEMFRDEVLLQRQLALQVESHVQGWVDFVMARLQHDIVLRTFVYRGLFHLFNGSAKFREANCANNNDPSRLNPALLHYLKVIQVHGDDWEVPQSGQFEQVRGQWWWPRLKPLLDYYRDNCYNTQALFPRKICQQDDNALHFLFDMTILTPNATNGELVEFLVDAMVEPTQQASRHFIEDRMRGKDLHRIEHTEAVQGDSVPQGQFDPIDPIQVRSQLICVCLIYGLFDMFTRYYQVDDIEQDYAYNTYPQF